MKKILIAIALTGCAGGQLDPRAQRAIDAFECRVAALTPYIGEVVDVGEVVSEFARGRVNLTMLLATLGHTEEQINEASAAWHACDTKPVAPPGATTLAFREPPY